MPQPGLGPLGHDLLVDARLIGWFPCISGLVFYFFRLTLALPQVPARPGAVQGRPRPPAHPEPFVPISVFWDKMLLPAGNSISPLGHEGLCRCVTLAQPLPAPVLGTGARERTRVSVCPSRLKAGDRLKRDRRLVWAQRQAVFGKERKREVEPRGCGSPGSSQGFHPALAAPPKHPPPFAGTVGQFSQAGAWDFREADGLSGFLPGSSSRCHCGSSGLRGKPDSPGHEQYRALRQRQTPGTLGCPHAAMAPSVVPAPPGQGQSGRPDPALPWAAAVSRARGWASIKGP